MNKKILLCTLAVLGVAQAKINVGLITQGSFLKPKTTFFGTDNFTANGQPFSNAITQKLNAFGGGILVGYEAETNKPLTTLFEADVMLFNKKVNGGTLISKDSAGRLGNNLDTESFTLTKKIDVGFNSSFAYAVSTKVDVLFGVRFNAAQYGLNITSATGTIPSEKFWTLGIEPNIGARFKMNDKVALRFSLGYNIAQKYTKVGYVTETFTLRDGAQGNISYKPSGVNVRFGATYSF